MNEVVINLYREIATAGELRPLVLVNEWSAFQPIETERDGRRTVYLRLSSPWSGRRSISTLLKWMLAAPVFLTYLLRFCQRQRVAAFNFHYAGLSCFPVALLRFLRLYRGSLILSFHGLDLQTAQRAGRIERALWRFVLHQATAVVACSGAFAAEVHEWMGSNLSGRLHTIHNGLDIDYFLTEVDRTIALPATLSSRDFVLAVATFEHKKGLDVLLRAFADVRASNPGLALVLVGKAAAAQGELRALAKELGVADDVFFFENVPHSRVGQFLERAKTFCLPSRYEPFGIAILEAGAYRLPVVASRVGGIPEIVIDGETGLLVAPDDVPALTSALDCVLRDAKLAEELGDRLYRRVASNFSWGQAHKKYRALLTGPKIVLTG